MAAPKMSPVPARRPRINATASHRVLPTIAIHNRSRRELRALASSFSTVKVSTRMWPDWLLAPAQLIQQRGGGEPVGHPSDLPLELADGRAGPRAEMSVWLADVETTAGKLGLQLKPLGAGQNPLVPRPALHKGTAAAQPVGQMADRECIGFRRIVPHDDPEIVQHQETRPLDARRHEQKGLLVRLWKRLPVGPHKPGLFPLTDGHAAVTVGEAEIESRRHDDLIAPRRSGHPAIKLQIVGSGSDEVRNGIDHVPPAVPVEIDGIALECARHELSRPERARPGADQLLRLEISPLDD